MYTYCSICFIKLLIVFLTLYCFPPAPFPIMNQLELHPYRKEMQDLELLNSFYLLPPLSSLFLPFPVLCWMGERNSIKKGEDIRTQILFYYNIRCHFLIPSHDLKWNFERLLITCPCIFAFVKLLPFKILNVLQLWRVSI